jgi:flagellar biosynthesis protein FliQ
VPRESRLDRSAPWYCLLNSAAGPFPSPAASTSVARVDLTALLIEALQLALWLATPALLACLCVAAITSVLQGKLQAGDPSIGFVPKVFVVLGTLWVSHGYLAERLTAFAGKLFQAMARL